MIITAIENTSMQGLIVDKIEVDNDALYISLIREDAENIEFEKLEEIEHQIIAFEETPYIVLRNVPNQALCGQAQCFWFICT